MEKPILESEEPKIVKKTRKPLSEEAKKKQLENLRKGREMAHEKRRQLEAMGRELAKQKTSNQKGEIASDTKVENVSDGTIIKEKKEKKKKIVYVTESESGSSSEEEVIVRKKKTKKQPAPAAAPAPPPPPPPRPKVDIEAERQKKIAIIKQQQINQKKLEQKQQFMNCIFGN
jgi:hypothetical protein